jgi:hypothetical protein
MIKFKIPYKGKSNTNMVIQGVNFLYQVLFYYYTKKIDWLKKIFNMLKYSNL